MRVVCIVPFCSYYIDLTIGINCDGVNLTMRMKDHRLVNGHSIVVIIHL